MTQNRWVLGARPRTLPAAVVPVIVGTACAWGVADRVVAILTSMPPQYVWARGAAAIDWINAVAALIVSLALQVATNYSNDYSDGQRGTDDPSQRVGPPRLVGNGLATPGEVKRAMLMAFAVALVAGAVLVLRVGWVLIPVGIAAIAAGYLYTGGPRPYGYLGLGEAFVFVFFGVVATVGSTFVQLERVTKLSLACSFAVGSLATALLVANNLRDIPGDTRSGKRTLAVRIGDRRTRYLYLTLLVVPFLLLPFIAGLGNRPLAAITFAAVFLATGPIIKVLGGAKGLQLLPVLAETGRLQLAFGLLLSAGLIGSTYL